ASATLSRDDAPIGERRVAVCVVACSGGYPGDYKKGVPIFGLDDVEVGEDLQVFHAGTKRSEQGDLQTAGGRVLAVTALGADADTARERAYGAMAKIGFDGMHFRPDIGAACANA
ncbi:MAG: phosphoribosylglycinamide synthetase C domain-containing protein, partial [Planctomycetota bacterium]|nr:phosphoribosylglycinamide synthetase C domain-containing protein [Planctomycetota bacterium]